MITNLNRYAFGMIIGVLIAMLVISRGSTPDYKPNGDKVAVVKECRVTLDGNGTVIQLTEEGQTGLVIHETQGPCYMILSSFTIMGMTPEVMTGIHVLGRRIMENRQ